MNTFFLYNDDDDARIFNPAIFSKSSIFCRPKIKLDNYVSIG